MKEQGFDAWFEKHRKFIFYALLTCIFCMIFVYNFLTPYLSDDYLYLHTVKQAGSFLDLFVQEYHHYLEHSGRNVVHLIMRFFMYTDKMVFNVFNSAAFVGLILLMYWNVEHRKKYDVWLLLSLVALMWFKAVAFSQTILWETGACNYLWGALIILGFVTLYRYNLQRENADKQGQTALRTNPFGQALKAFGFFVFGIPAGWCNENTSGGGILLCAMFLFLYFREQKERKIRPWMIAGVVGQCVGLLFMIASPGGRARALVEEEEHSGLFGLAARFQKIVLRVREQFFLLMAIWIVVFVLCRVQRKTIEEMKTALCYMIAFAATSCALIATAPTQARAYFGAGIFLMISLLSLITEVNDKNELIRTAKLGTLGVVLLLFTFNYLDDGANLYRVRRDILEREAYILEQKAQGKRHMTVAKMRPDFMTDYTDAFLTDLEYDTGYWMNLAYAAYYDLDYIRAVPREEWEELVGYNEDE